MLGPASIGARSMNENIGSGGIAAIVSGLKAVTTLEVRGAAVCGQDKFRAIDRGPPLRFQVRGREWRLVDGG